MTSPEPNGEREWEKEFDQKFIELHPRLDCTKPTPIWNVDALKSFIRQTLTHHQHHLVESLCGEVEGMKKDTARFLDVTPEQHKGHKKAWLNGYNTALNDVLSRYSEGSKK